MPDWAGVIAGLLSASNGFCMRWHGVSAEGHFTMTTLLSRIAGVDRQQSEAFTRTRYDVWTFSKASKRWARLHPGLPSHEAESIILDWNDDTRTPILWPAKATKSPADVYGDTPPEFEPVDNPRWSVGVRLKGEDVGQCAMVTDIGLHFVEDWLAEQNFGDDVEVDVRYNAVCRGIVAFNAPYGSGSTGFIIPDHETIDDFPIDSRIDYLWDEMYNSVGVFRDGRPQVEPDSRAMIRSMIRMLEEMYGDATPASADDVASVGDAESAEIASDDAEARSRSLDHLLSLARAGKGDGASAAERQARKIVQCVLNNAIGLDASATVGIAELVDLIQQSPGEGRDEVRRAIQ